MENFSAIGKKEPKKEAMERATGEAKFTADFYQPNMLCGKILRSRYPHAKILKIDTSKAKRLMGVKTVVTARDIPDVRFGWAINDEALFAKDKVRHLGEQVAAVAAVDEETAEEALDMIDIDYEELKGVFDPKEAMTDYAPIIHEDLLHYENRWPLWNIIRKGNICSSTQICQGDAEKGFKESDFIFEDAFKVPMVHQSPLEPHSALASIDCTGRITVWASTQAPFANRSRIAEILRIPLTHIRVIAPHVGGGFGGKLHGIPAASCAVLTKETGKTIKMILTREEEFIYGRPRHPGTVKLKTGVKRDGILLARQAEIILDTGAYADWGPFVLSYSATFVRGPYRIPNVKIDGFCVYTNKTPSGAFRGFGSPQVTFCYESQMDAIAEKLNMDPLELRLKNGIERGDRTVVGQELVSVGLKETLKKATERVNWKHKGKEKYPGHGIGLACMDYACGFLSSSAAVRLNEDGTICVLSGSMDIGQGSSTALRQIAAEELGVPVEDVSITNADTETSPYDYGTVGSRTVHTMGRAVKAAVRDVKEQIFKIASQHLEAHMEDLDIRDRRIFVKGSPERSILIGELARASLFMDGPIVGRGSFNPQVQPVDPTIAKGYAFPTLPAYIYATQIAEVEVDKEVGKVKVLEMTAAHDCGKAINPLTVEGQIQGAIGIGIGYALTEETLWLEGQMFNPSLLSYSFPTSLDVPEVEPLIVEEHEPTGPFGAKGVGEPGLTPTAPAIANAIYNAIGLRIKELPITPEKILEALEE